MSAPEPGRCFFIDSCVALAEMLGENGEVMEKFKTDAQRRGIHSYLPSSAVSECDKKLNFSQTFFEKVFQTFAEVHFNESRRQLGMNPGDPLCREDFRIFASLFTELRKSMSPILAGPLRTLEIKMVLALEDLLRKGARLEFSTFLRQFVAQAMILAAHLKIQKIKYIANEQGFFKVKNISPDRTTSDRLVAALRRARFSSFHIEDSDNISSAWAHKQSSGENTVFVTLDFRSVLCCAEEIFSNVGVWCADPLYAVHFF